MSAIRTKGLRKTYGAVEALRGVDLDIPTGSVYGLVGPNGSGKTTALEIIVGLRRATAGSVEIAGPPEAVAYCPDVAEFEPWLTAEEVVASAAGLLGQRPSSAAIEAVLDRVGLTHAARRRVGGYSRGMRSRLGLAAGLIGEPRVLIADEPAAALDPAGRWEIIDLLAELGGETTVIVSSHDLTDVQRICDHVGVLSAGQLAYQGGLDDLLAMASSELRLVVRPPADAVLAALSAAPWVRAVREDAPGVLMVEPLDAVAAERELPGLLAATGASLVELGRAEETLLDVFFRLTRTGPYRAHPAETRS